MTDEPETVTATAGEWTYEFRRAANVDTGVFRHSLAAGALAGVSTYAALAAHGPYATPLIALATGGYAALAMLVWRVVESDRRAFEVTRKRAQDAPEPEPVADERPVRPFVASTNGGGVANGQTVKVAGIAQPASTWQRLLETAERDGWTISRDAMRQNGGMLRRYVDRWADTVGELERAGMVEKSGNQTRLTEEGIRAIENVAPPLRGRLAPRVDPHSGGRRAAGSGG